MTWPPLRCVLSLPSAPQAGVRHLRLPTQRICHFAKRPLLCAGGGLLLGCALTACGAAVQGESVLSVSLTAMDAEQDASKFFTPMLTGEPVPSNGGPPSASHCASNTVVAATSRLGTP